MPLRSSMRSATRRGGGCCSSSATRGRPPVGAIAAELPVSRPAVSQHLRVLEGAGLVTSEKHGTRHLYAVQPDGLAVLRLWLDGFWDDALARFKRAAEGSEGE